MGAGQQEIALMEVNYSQILLHRLWLFIVYLLRFKKKFQTRKALTSIQFPSILNFGDKVALAAALST